MQQVILTVCLFFITTASALFAQENPARQTPAKTPADSVQIQQPATVETLSVQPKDSLPSNAAGSGWTTRDYLTLVALALSLLAFLFGLHQYRRRIALEKEKTTAQEQAKYNFKKQVEPEERTRLLQETQDKKLAELQAQEQFKEQRQQQKSRTAEEAYCESLRDELGNISLLGSPDVRNVSLNLIDCFVNLDISERWHSEEVPVLGEHRDMLERERDYPPNKAIERALKIYKHRLLLIIGDPGSGKTTLMKFYALKCLEDKHGALGFDSPRLPIFLPLRDVDPEKPFAANLAEREKTRPHPLSESEINTWLSERDTLILLDGLDEVSQIDDRIRMCRWIENQCRAIRKAFFVVTSRWTGYRKADGVELEIKHLRADVRDFTLEQQKEFLQKWFRAVFLSEDLPDSGPDEAWQTSRLALAGNKANAIIDYLERKENKSLRQLAAIPMLLQIMAIIWKEQQYLPRNRATLYDAALNYLLEHRDRHRQLYPILSAALARSVLSPAALWMQEDLHAEEIEKEALHEKLQPGLNEMEEQPSAKAFCENLRDRAGVIADYGKNEYIFRHKSFREYLAGMQLAEVFHEEGRMQRLVEAFGDDWWEEPLRFFISKPNSKLFDSFMQALFRSPKSRELNDKQQDLLRYLVQEAGQRKINSLSAFLNDIETTENQKRYILDCLKNIGTDQAIIAIFAFFAGERFSDFEHDLRMFFENKNNPELASKYLKPIQKFFQNYRLQPDNILDGTYHPLGSSIRNAHSILLDILISHYIKVSESEISPFKTRSSFFHNPLEYNAEYILIKGGRFVFQKGSPREMASSTISRGEKLEAEKSVPDIYFAKYPVTNKRYRRFMRYLRAEESELEKQIPLQTFHQKLRGFTAEIKGFADYLGEDVSAWADKLKSKYDDDRKFNGDDQPVVGVSWFAARAYCFWLSLFADPAASATASATAPATAYRLPQEVEWEWAAAGDRQNEKGELHKYPWGNAEPNDKLANYGHNVGATTPVGRYPEGATPEGLLDMAGNVWEWQENWSSESEKYRALRGGSWAGTSVVLRCDARSNDVPRGWINLGFRVVLAQSLF